MVEADPLVSAARESIHGHPEEMELLVSRGERPGVDEPLVGAHARHMRVVVAGDPIGLERESLAQGVLEASRCLARQSVDQIDVDALEPRLPRQVHRPPDFRFRLQPPDRGLHHRIEVLHPEADPPEAELTQPRDLVPGHQAGVGLERALAVRPEGEAALQHPDEAVALREGQEVRRPPSQMELLRPPVPA